MTLYDIEIRLRKRFLFKICKHHSSWGGKEIRGTGDTKQVIIISGQEYKRVINIGIHGPPSGWYWTAWLVFEDGSKSAYFSKMSDIDIQEVNE